MIVAVVTTMVEETHTHEKMRTQSSHPAARMITNRVHSLKKTKMEPMMEKVLMIAAVCAARYSITD